MEEANIKQQVIRSWWLLSIATTEDGMYIWLNGWIFGIISVE